ncbi:hypothetical protein [Roseinatronobacter alkalisoli]|uniref:DUF1266 domain-containing protein n=1 Tax=Roseinatronobacter alkalisoli TaxID=3028235 RepID=A0ABT5THX2_9RHOB|nr:hypothetical protein [Roseinatronobacter sp. HJB301]MDD7973802.1 hypothetical protein [Roseinatronobacter sp. HJB301]
MEIPDTSETFLLQAANKNSHSALDQAREIVAGLGRGAYSWPYDYTVGIHWVVAHAGIYGPRAQQNAFYHRDRILKVLGAGVRVIYYLVFRGLLWRLLTNETAQNLAREQLGQADREAFDRAIDSILPSGALAAQMAGRYASGEFFRRWMETRVRRAGGGRLETRGAAWTNMIILFWGSAVHSSVKNPTNFGIIEIFIAWITGDTDHQIDTEAYVAVFRAAQALTENASFMDALGSDFELYREFIQAVLDFGSSGGRR